MEDMRPGLRHGDLTTTGGVITATGRMRFHGKEVAAEGDLATCPACKSVGYLVNDAYPAFGLPSGRQLAIQGAWIFCKCANPPRAIASTDKFRVAVNRAGSGMPVSVSAKSAFTAPLGGHNRVPLPSSSLKETDQKSTLEDDPQLICPNMSNAEFAQMVMQRRDKAVSLIDKRLTELAGWPTAARVRVAQWFGNSDVVTRDYLAGGLARIRHILAGLTPNNFVRYSGAAMAHVGCVSDSKRKLGVVAEVCAPETATHTIAIHLDFCELRDFAYSMDSQVSTLIHEVSHFHDTMNTGDAVYFMRKCRDLAKSNPEITLQNADSIAGYVIYED